MGSYSTLGGLFTAIAAAIRSKKSSTGAIVANNFPEEILSITTGGNYQSKTASPTTFSQTIRPDSGYDALSSVTVSAMPTGSVSNPTASKSVSGNSATITPSVTSTTGYITGGTRTGTAATVTASELTSGSLSINSNGTYNITNYASVIVNVGGGGGGAKKATATSTLTAENSSISFNVSGEPTAFVVMAQGNITGSSSGRVINVSWLDNTYSGNTMTTQSNACQYVETGFAKSFSNGVLTLTYSGTFAATTYEITYVYDGTPTVARYTYTPGSGVSQAAFSNVTVQPTWYVCRITAAINAGASSYSRAIALTDTGDGAEGFDYGTTMRYGSMWTSTYSGTTFTVRSNGTNNGGYFHTAVYELYTITI